MDVPVSRSRNSRPVGKKLSLNPINNNHPQFDEDIFEPVTNSGAMFSDYQDIEYDGWEQI